MTDITHEAPERMWIDPDILPSEWHKQYHCDVEYVRFDLVQAAVAAALREAAEAAEGYYSGLGDWLARHGHSVSIRDYILALITPDAQAALDRVVAAERTMMPIATAPREGTHILVAPYGDPTDLQVSWFIDGEDRWANWSWSVEPSHWFPLPVIRKGGA